MQQELDYKIKTNTEVLIPEPSPMELIDDYSSILEEYSLKYEKADCYYQVGLPDWKQGWIIDISVIVIQVKKLIINVLPVLIREKTSFKIARSSEHAEFILDGKFGSQLLGKILTIFPANETQALSIAEELIYLTQSFRGPHILTDRHLGAAVYTRYGSCKPIIQTTQSGAENKMIYDPLGQLIEEPFDIPFKLPQNVTWPFLKITSPNSPKRETVLQDRYKPMYNLKEDVKGGVRKGLFLEKLWRVKWCVIKEAKQNMKADNEGRDAAERLVWQYELNNELKEIVPMPKIYDLFKENGDTYLIMEFIKGPDLDQIIVKIFENKRLDQIPLSDWLKLFNYCTQILDIIEQMHAKGYLHRDITPVNFLVTKKQKLYLIDLELSYSLNTNKPTPPFRMGTQGFTSPEQERVQQPTKKQDIYALGGTLIALLTGLLPGLLSIENKEVLKSQLRFFISDEDLINVLGNCIDIDPYARPTISHLREALGKYMGSYKSTYYQNLKKYNVLPPDREYLQNIILKSISGLTSPAMMNGKQLWFSKTTSVEGVSHQLRSFSVYNNFCQGISGVLFLLARANSLGLSIETCMEGYKTGIAFISKNSGHVSNENPAGLYLGSAGVAMSLAEGIHSGLLNEKTDTFRHIKLCLQNSNIVGSGVVKGLAGQGMALLRVSLLTDESYVHVSLQNIIDQLLQLQQEGGYWITTVNKRSKDLVFTGFGHGVAGIICFLLSYLKSYKRDDKVVQSVLSALDWLTKKIVNKGQHQSIWYLNNEIKQYSTDFQDGCAGIVLSLIKAYEIFGDHKYRELAENCLRNHIEYGINRNLTLGNGLVGIGEVCLEAAITFNSQEWQQRVDWINQFLMHNYRTHYDGSCYWLADGTPVTTAGLMDGNSGIIHFLLRCYHQGRLSHPMMVWQ